MIDFVETMRLKGMAEEDIYFARRDRELSEALRRNKRQPFLPCSLAWQQEFSPSVGVKSTQHAGDKHERTAHEIGKIYLTQLFRTFRVKPGG